MALAPRRAISPSQFGTAGKCAWAYEYAYRSRMKPPSKGVQLLTGSVLHHARERWILDHSLDMVELTRKAWRDLASDTPLYRVVVAYEKLADKSRQLCKDILLARPDIKEPTRTKDYKQSEIGKLMAQFERNREKQLAEDDYDWQSKSFTEAYNNTLNVAEKYQERYQDSLPALLSELQFSIELDGLAVTGVIDDIRLLISPDGEPIGYGIVDGKTYTTEPEPLKDFVQLATYNIAGETCMQMWLEDAGIDFNPDLPIVCGLDLMALLDYKWYQFTPEQLGIAKALIIKYDAYRQVDVGLPNFKGRCDWCEWVDICRDRVGMRPVALKVL